MLPVSNEMHDRVLASLPPQISRVWQRLLPSKIDSRASSKCRFHRHVFGDLELLLPDVLVLDMYFHLYTLF